mmetsp:Transcript_13734/g.33128  ORF Transcript_13734/g.33128 Transcript_13734/m.33128 type:complete len:216 (+) Transcript_13734:305-952(+)
MRAEAEGIAREMSPTLLNPNQSSVHEFFYFLTHRVYWSWPSPVKPWDVGNGIEATFSAETDVFLTVQSLLVQAGWNTPDKYGFFRSCSIDVNTLPRLVLKKEFRTPCKAKKKIFEALQIDDVRLFREQIQSAKLLNATFDFSHPGDEYVGVILRTNGKTLKRELRNAHRADDCAECGRDDAQRFCPCRTASYCSEECQRAHWKVHKRSCPNLSSQ